MKFVTLRALCALFVFSCASTAFAASPPTTRSLSQVPVEWEYNASLYSGAGGYQPIMADPGTGYQGIVIEGGAPSLPSASASISGTTSATASTWTSALASSASRKGCTVQNSSTAIINIAMGSTTPTAPEFTLQPGQAFNCIDQQQVWVMSSTASVSYQGASW